MDDSLLLLLEFLIGYRKMPLQLSHYGNSKVYRFVGSFLVLVHMSGNDDGTKSE